MSKLTHPFRLLIYSDSGEFGGHEVITGQIANVLGRHGRFEVSCMFRSDQLGDSLEPSIEKWRLSFDSKSFGFSAAPPWCHLWQLRRQVGALEPDVMVVAQGYVESGVVGLWVARSLGVPAVSYIPFGYSNREINTRHAWLRDCFLRHLLRLPDAFVTISDFQLRLLRRFVASTVPILRIDNPSSTVPMACPTELPDTPSTDPIDIGLVGRILFRQKNQDIVVKAAAILEQLGANFCVHVIGDGPDRQRLEALVAEHRLAERFKFVGWLTPDRLDPYIAEHVDVVLIPSRYEGLPLVMLEAFRWNKPFLVSRLGFTEGYGIPDDMQFAPQAAEEIAERIMSLPDRFDPKHFAAIRDNALERHSVERFEDNTITTMTELVSELVGQNGRAPTES